MFRTICNLCHRVSLENFSWPNRTLIRSYGRNGQVSRGMFDILKELPIINVTVEDLPALVANPGVYPFVELSGTGLIFRKTLIYAR